MGKSSAAYIIGYKGRNGPGNLPRTFATFTPLGQRLYLFNVYRTTKPPGEVDEQLVGYCNGQQVEFDVLCAAQVCQTTFVNGVPSSNQECVCENCSSPMPS